MSSSDGGDGAATAPADTPAEDEQDAPRDERREELVEAFRAELGEAVVGTHVVPGVDAWVRVTADAWVAAGTFARDRLACTYFDFLSAVDWMPSPFGRDMDAQEDLLAGGGDTGGDDTAGGDEDAMEQGYAGGETRFQLLARVHSPAEGHGVFLKCDLPDEPPTVDTWVPVYAGANWHERETAEMFGIVFTGHPHPVNLYLPGAFEGHPLRKDFPLLSRRVKPWPGIVDVEAMPGDGEDGDGDGEGSGA